MTETIHDAYVDSYYDLWLPVAGESDLWRCYGPYGDSRPGAACSLAEVERMFGPIYKAFKKTDSD